MLEMGNATSFRITSAGESGFLEVVTQALGLAALTIVDGKGCFAAVDSSNALVCRWGESEPSSGVDVEVELRGIAAVCGLRRLKELMTTHAR